MQRPPTRAMRALVTGTATHAHLRALKTALLRAQQPDALAALPGVQGHMQTAGAALGDISTRACSADLFPIPHYHEVDALRIALDLHALQLRAIARARRRRMRARRHAK